MSHRHSGMAGWLGAMLLAGVFVTSGGAGADEGGLATIKGASHSPRARVLPDDLPEVQALCAEARDHLDADDAERALGALDRALRLTGDTCYEPLALAALAHWTLGNDGQAQVAAGNAVELFPERADAWYVLGLISQREGNDTDAIARFRSATLAAEREPDNPLVAAAWYQLGECLSAAGRPRAAAEAYAKFDKWVWVDRTGHRDVPEIARLVAEHPNGMLETRVALLREAGSLDDVVAATTEAIERAPEDARVGRLHVRALLDAGASSSAWDVCRRFVSVPETMPEFLTLACQTALAADTLDTWVGDVAKSVSDGGAMELAEALADELHRTGHARLTVPLWEALLGRRSADARVAWSLARSWCERGDLRKSWGVLMGFTRENPGLVELPHEPLVGWARDCAPADRVAELAGEFGADVDHDFATDFVLGLAAAAAGDDALAEKHLAACREARPDFALARLAWPRLLALRYQWEDARARLKPVLEEAPHLAEALALMGEIALGVDERELAAEYFRRALTLKPDSSVFALHLAEYYRDQGDLPATQRFYQQALSADPSNGVALEGVVDAYLAGGKVELAAAQLEQVADSAPRDALRRARTTMRFGESPASEEHLAELRRQFDKYPNDTSTGERLATGLYVRGRIDEARDVIEAVYARIPDDEDAALLMAQLYLTRLECGPAIEIVERLAHNYPCRDRLKSLLAGVYRGDFQTEKQRSVLVDLLSGDLEPGERRGYQIRLLNSYLAFSEFDAALRYLDEWGADQETRAFAMRQRVAILMEAERCGEAVATALEWLEAEPDNEERRLLYADALLAAERYVELETVVCKWREGGPAVAAWLYSHVEALLGLGRPDEALEAIGAFTPETVAAGLALRMLEARCDVAAGNVAEAVTRLLRLLEEPVVRSTPGQLLSVRQLLIEILVEASEFDQALDLCGAWWRRGPHDVETRQLLLEFRRVIYQVAGRQAEYEATMERLLALRPDDAGLNNDLGYSWLEQNRDVERAMEMIRGAVAADPLNAAFLDSLGWAYYKTGEFELARKYLGRAVLLRDGQDPLVYDHLADACVRVDDVAGARGHWGKALELISDAGNDDSGLDHTELAEEIRAKLAALDADREPEVAPTANEQAERSE